MANSKSYNNAINCSVSECEYHKGDKNYCTLPSIDVGTHEFYPTQKQCTDCQSFSLKSSLMDAVIPQKGQNSAASQATSSAKQQKGMQTSSSAKASSASGMASKSSASVQSNNAGSSQQQEKPASKSGEKPKNTRR